MKLTAENWKEVFWSRVAKTDNCWLWTGKLGNGYGFFQCPHRKRSITAHKVAYEMVHGVVAPGLVVDHKCRNRACVRPDHLRAVTPLVNTLENSAAVTAINAAKTTCIKGHPLVKRKGNRRHCLVCNRAFKRAHKARKLQSISSDGSGTDTKGEAQ